MEIYLSMWNKYANSIKVKFYVDGIKPFLFLVVKVLTTSILITDL